MEEQKRITKQFVISQTILYVFIVAFVVVFKTIFGEKNTLIGVTSITAMLMLMRVNLTISPGRNFMKLLVINIGMGIFSYLTQFNAWTAIPLNFIAVFIISYTFYFNLKLPIYLPFSLQYLFLIATPITSAELPMRLLSLLVGPILIIIIQLVINKNKITKVGNILIDNICDDLIKKINNNSDKDEINKSIQYNSNEFKKIIFDNRKDNFYLTEEGRIKLNIVVILEKLSNLLDEKSNSNDKKILDNLTTCLKRVKESLGKEDNLTNIKDNTSNLLDNYKKEYIFSVHDLRMINTINMLNIALEELKSLGKENYNNIKAYDDIPDKYKMVNVHKKEFYKRSVKFSYTVRVALGITISAFIAEYFKLSEGRWIYFTALSIIIPIYELSKKKMKDRIFATLVGGAIVVISFTIFTNSLVRVLIVMVSGYLNSYISTYRYKTICTTIGAIGSAAMLGGAVVLTMDRILFVILGTIIALIINKFIFPVKMKDANKELMDTYSEVVSEMLTNIYEEANNQRDNTHEINTLLIVSSMIEERVSSNNGDSFTKEDGDYFNKIRGLVVDIHQLYTLVKRKEFSNEDKYILEDLKELSIMRKENIDNYIKVVEGHIESAKGINNKIIFASIRGVLSQIKEIRNVNNVSLKGVIE